jgi:signal transduction histidine kinase/ActR/RegA family two-component response regulator
MSLARSVRVGYDSNPPFLFQGPDGKPRGLSVELLSMAAERLKLRLDWVYAPEGLDRALGAHRVDIWPIGMNSSERAERFAVSDTWLSADLWAVWVVNQSGRTRPRGSQVLVTHAPLAFLDRIREREFPGAQFRPSNNREANMAALCRGDIHVLILETRTLMRWSMVRAPECEGVQYGAEVLSDATFGLSIIGQKERAAEVRAIRQEMAELARRGQLRPAFSRWSVPFADEIRLVANLQQIEQNRLFLLIGIGLLLALLGLGGFLAWRLRAARKEADRANRAKSEFLANMSHEIRTPLNGILGINDLMLATELTADQKEFARLIQTSGRALGTILNDILDLSKIEAGRLTIETVAFAWRPLLEETVQMFQPEALRKGLDLSTDLDVAAPDMVQSDPVRIRQIVSNFLGNAVKFTLQGSVKLSARVAAGSLRFTVRDTGPGLAAERVARVFERFEQGDASTTRKHGGTGLGLAISREIAELLGGTIGVESEPGQGAEFWCEIPVGEVAEAQPAGLSGLAPAMASAPSLQGCRVLVAEDNVVNQRVVVHWLRRFGCVPALAADGQEALALMGRQEFDVVLLDCHMPVMDGYEALRHLRADSRWRYLPVVAVTANAMAGERERCLALGFSAYLSKPVSSEDLRHTLAGCLTPSNPQPQPLATD